MNAQKIATVLVGMMLLLSASAKQKVVNVTTPGSLSSAIPANKIGKIKDLKVCGTLNGADLKFLRRLMGSDTAQTAGKMPLARLDISDVKLLKGDEPYSDSGKKITNENAIPEEAFANCHVGEIIMPKALTEVETRAFYNSKVKRVVLAENTSLAQAAFDSCSQLEEIVFPQLMGDLRRCITNCPMLKSLRMHSVRYISGNGTVRNCENLKEIIIDGPIQHIDGWKTFSDCPNLERIVFAGNIISSGGGNCWLANCPKLKEIVFEKSVLSTAFAETPGCPLFKGYTVNGVVFSSNNTEILPESNLDDANKRAQYCEILESIIEDNKLFGEEKPNILVVFGYFATKLKDEKIDTQDLKSQILTPLKKEVETGDPGLAQRASYTVYDWLKGDAEFQKLLEQAKENRDYIGLLRKYSAYTHSGQTQPEFHYYLNAPILQEIRTAFNLDSIAGNGDEISRIKNVMYWLHDAIEHDGSSSWPNCKFNALELYRFAKRKKRGLNCRFLAMMLADCYMALGMPARFITCSSKWENDPDCHVTTIVWSKTLSKWIWMDPSFAAYITDENGTLLNHREVRKRLAEALPLNLNEDANWNHRSKQTKEDYLENYMAKNLFYLSCHAENRPEVESDGNESAYITLLPQGVEYNAGGTKTTDEDYFWQAPKLEQQ